MKFYTVCFTVSEERFCTCSLVHPRKYHMCNSESNSPGFCHSETCSCWLAASLSLVLEKWYWLFLFKAVTTFVFLHLSCFCRTLSCLDRDVDWACSSILTYKFDPARRNKAFWCCGVAVRVGIIFSLEGSICSSWGEEKPLKFNKLNLCKSGGGTQAMVFCDRFSHSYPTCKVQCLAWRGLGKGENLCGKENLPGLLRPNVVLFLSQWTKCQIKSIATASSRRWEVG